MLGDDDEVSIGLDIGVDDSAVVQTSRCGIRLGPIQSHADRVTVTHSNTASETLRELCVGKGPARLQVGATINKPHIDRRRQTVRTRRLQRQTGGNEGLRIPLILGYLLAGPNPWIGIATGSIESIREIDTGRIHVRLWPRMR